MARFPVIYADPPWEHRDKDKDGDRGACCKYPVMNIDDICNLPVSDICTPDAILFMWVSEVMPLEAFRVAEAWGFKHKTTGVTWIKLTKDGRPKIGQGHYTRSNVERCLIFTRRHSKIYRVKACSSVGQVVMSVPSRKHSRKPFEARRKIEQLLHHCPRVELFATQVVPGWIPLGGEVDGQDIRVALPELARVSIEEAANRVPWEKAENENGHIAITGQEAVQNILGLYQIARRQMVWQCP